MDDRERFGSGEVDNMQIAVHYFIEVFSPTVDLVSIEMLGGVLEQLRLSVVRGLQSRQDVVVLLSRSSVC